MKDTFKGAVIASAVAALFAMGAAQAQEKATKEGAKEKKIHCAGVNECKGKGGCSGANNDCAGKNECKGKGWMAMTAKDCQDKGGTVAAKKK